MLCSSTLQESALSKDSGYKTLCEGRLEHATKLLCELFDSLTKEGPSGECADLEDCFRVEVQTCWPLM